MPLKAGEAKAGILELFPSGIGKKPKEGEIRPSDIYEFEAGMSRALAKLAPASAAAPRGAGMTQVLMLAMLRPRLPAQNSNHWKIASTKPAVTPAM